MSSSWYSYQLRCNVLVKDLRYLFCLHPNFVSRILTTWINFLYEQTCCPTKNNRHTYKHSIFPTWCLQLSKSKQNAKTVLMRFTFPINAHQTKANQKRAFILDAVYTSTPANLPFRLLEGLVLRLGAPNMA